MLAISAREWNGIESRPHHLMRLCAKSGWQVLYLEPPASLAAPIKDGSKVHRWRQWLRRLRSVEDGIFLLAPPPSLPFGNKWSWINKVNQWVTSRTLIDALQKLGVDEIDTYAFLPTAVDLLPLLPCRTVIYDCVDDHSAFPGLIDPRLVRQMEKRLIGQSDVTFVTARSLYEERRDWSRNLHLIQNGCDYEHFSVAAKNPGLPPPPDLAEILSQKSTPSSPSLVGLVGAIGDWVDLDLLDEIAQQSSNLLIVLIGPELVNVSRLAGLSNVCLLGPKPYRELPAYLRYFSVCLIPFRINSLTNSVNPIKLFEYLAAGKPVVSTPIPEVEQYSNVVDIAEGADGFLAAIERAVSATGKDPAAIAARQATAKANSWRSRWNSIERHILALRK